MPTERTTKHSKEQEQDGEMSLSGHLRELRNRILICVIVLVVAILAGLLCTADRTDVSPDGKRSGL